MLQDEICSECGAAVTGGQTGCQALFDELTLQAYSDLRYAATHSLAFDSYCMQHVEPYCHSAKSYAAHLTRLCCGLEHAGDPTIYAAIQQWLNGSVDIEKPIVLNKRGQLTLIDVRAARTAQEHKQLVHDWANHVWDAYASQHELAHVWIEMALKRGRH